MRSKRSKPAANQHICLCIYRVCTVMQIILLLLIRDLRGDTCMATDRSSRSTNPNETDPITRDFKAPIRHPSCPPLAILPQLPHLAIDDAFSCAQRGGWGTEILNQPSLTIGIVQKHAFRTSYHNYCFSPTSIPHRSEVDHTFVLIESILQAIDHALPIRSYHQRSTIL